MKITEYGSIKTAGSVKKRPGVRSAGAFAELLASTETEGASTASDVSDVAATGSINNLLALQGISEEEAHRRKAVQYGKNLLDAMEKLRQQLLIGSVPLHTLKDLAHQLSLQKQSVADPRLHALIEDIELRAAVELAKLEAARRS